MVNTRYCNAFKQSNRVPTVQAMMHDNSYVYVQLVHQQGLKVNDSSQLTDQPETQC